MAVGVEYGCAHAELRRHISNFGKESVHDILAAHSDRHRVSVSCEESGQRSDLGLTVATPARRSGRFVDVLERPTLAGCRPGTR